MTPKEKAEALVDAFMNIKSMKLSDYSVIYHPTAKQCARIAVAEILLTLNKDIRDLDVVGNVLLDLIEYWQQVEQEIENL
jgi:hypothetical protein